MVMVTTRMKMIMRVRWILLEGRREEEEEDGDDELENREMQASYVCLRTLQDFGGRDRKSVV